MHPYSSPFRITMVAIVVFIITGIIIMGGIHYYGDYCYYLGGMLNSFESSYHYWYSNGVSIPPFAPQAETVISPYWMQPHSPSFQNLSGSNPSIILSATNAQTSIPSFASQAETVISPSWLQPPSHWFQNLSGSNPSVILSDSNPQSSIPSFASQAENVISASWMQPASPWFQNFSGSNLSIIPSDSNPQTSRPSSSSQKENQSFYAKLDKKFRSFKHFDTVSGRSDRWFKDCKAAGELS